MRLCLLGLACSRYYMRHMSTDTTLQIESTSSDATEAIASKIANRLKGGEVIELISDLGGGKTTFTRGIARGLDVTDKVASPTFTISKVYAGGKLELHHFDFYRLADAGLAANELHDLIGDPELVVVVEWAEVVAHVLPSERLSVTIVRTDENTRSLRFVCPQSLHYLVEQL